MIVNYNKTMLEKDGETEENTQNILMQTNSHPSEDATFKLRLQG